MRYEIDRMPDKKKLALTLAQGKCREEEFSDSRLEVFLRSEGMNAKLAAQRFVEYWQCRLDLFGPDKYTQQMALSEALCDDLVALQCAVFHLLPFSDASGRRIVFAEPCRNTKIGYTTESLVRAIWYLHEIIVRQSDYDGCILLAQ